MKIEFKPALSHWMAHVATSRTAQAIHTHETQVRAWQAAVRAWTEVHLPGLQPIFHTVNGDVQNKVTWGRVEGGCLQPVEALPGLHPIGLQLEFEWETFKKRGLKSTRLTAAGQALHDAFQAALHAPFPTAPPPLIAPEDRVVTLDGSPSTPRIDPMLGTRIVLIEGAAWMDGPLRARDPFLLPISAREHALLKNMLGAPPVQPVVRALLQDQLDAWVEPVPLQAATAEDRTAGAVLLRESMERWTRLLQAARDLLDTQTSGSPPGVVVLLSPMRVQASPSDELREHRIINLSPFVKPGQIDTIGTIKAVREMTGLGLKATVDLVHNLPAELPGVLPDHPLIPLMQSAGATFAVPTDAGSLHQALFPPKT